jgi:hypothetical protein
MQLKEYIVEGQTGRIKETLLADGEPLNLTGMTVDLILTGSDGVVVDYDGTDGVEAASEGKVYFDPADGDLLESLSPYTATWEVTDGSGKVVHFPQREPILLYVRKP